MSAKDEGEVKAIWVDQYGHPWKVTAPMGPLQEPHRRAYLHIPPEGAPEPGEKRRGKGGTVYTLQYAYRHWSGEWMVALKGPDGNTLASLWQWRGWPMVEQPAERSGLSEDALVRELAYASVICSYKPGTEEYWQFIARKVVQGLKP